jgi:hypothetical protein
LDYGGDGAQPTTTNPTVYIGASVLLFGVTNNFIATNQNGGQVIEVGAPTANATDGLYYNGLYITGNYIQSYITSSWTNKGIFFDAGSNYRRDVWLDNNQFFQLNFGILMQHGIQYSSIVGNYGMSIGSDLIVPDAAGATSFFATVIHDNTTPDSVNVVYDDAGGGYVMGYNFSGSSASPFQYLGTQIATGSGCSISSGTIGTVCGPVTMAIPITFADTGYSVTGCTLQGASGEASPTLVKGSAANSSFTLYEVSQTTAAVSGGTFACTVTHN